MGGTPNGQPTGEQDLQGVPLPKIGSESSGGERSSEGTPKFDGIDLEKLADAVISRAAPKLRETLKPDISSETERVVQSVKDVRWLDTWKKIKDLDINSLSAVAELLKRHNGNVEEAERDLAVQALISERRATAQQPGPESQPAPSSSDVLGKTQKEMKEKVVKALQAFKLPDETNQAILTKWSESGEYPSFEDALIGLNALVAEVQAGSSGLTQQRATPTGAGLGLPGSGPSLPKSAAEREKAADELRVELNTLMRDYSQNRDKILDIQKKLRELGDTHI